MEEVSPADINALLAEQAAFDADYFDRRYESLTDEQAAIRHILEHLDKAGGKLAIFHFHGSSLAVVEEVIPDLYINYLRLRNKIGVATKISVPEVNSFHDLGWLLHLVGGQVAVYPERLEHGDRANARLDAIQSTAIPGLSVAAHWLADHFDIDLLSAVRDRNGQIAEDIDSSQKIV